MTSPFTPAPGTHYLPATDTRPYGSVRAEALDAVRALLTYCAGFSDEGDLLTSFLSVVSAETILTLGEDVVASDGYSEDLYILSFGAYGDTVRVVRSGGFCDALEEAADTLPPGVFTDPEYEEVAKELGVEWDPSGEDEAHERVCNAAEVDLTYTEAGWIASWEWGGDEFTVAQMCEWLTDRAKRSTRDHISILYGE
jgi:hypothetical protein